MVALAVREPERRAPERVRRRVQGLSPWTRIVLYRDAMKMRLFAANTVVSLAVFTAACASMPGAGNSASAFSGSDSGQLLSVDHYVRVKSTAPAMNGQIAQVYVRERVVSRNILRGG